MAQQINLYLCEPRGFCGGVIRAIDMVEGALKDFGAPVYVLGEIVHNKHVVSELAQKGVVFVKSLDEVARGRPLILSAHGVAKDVQKKAESFCENIIDATCPLVKKVHEKVEDLEKGDSEIIIIGKRSHPEIMGTKGQAKDETRVHVIESVGDVRALNLNGKKIGFVTQTTLSVDEVADIVEALKNKFPNIDSLSKSDICFATTHRQAAVKDLAKKVGLVIVIGSKNSSNSNKLKEIALKNGAKEAVLIDDVSELDWSLVDRYSDIGISAGASAPEHLVQELVDEFEARYGMFRV